jgi:hypothetical protein
MIKGLCGDVDAYDVFGIKFIATDPGGWGLGAVLGDWGQGFTRSCPIPVGTRSSAS